MTTRWNDKKMKEKKWSFQKTLYCGAVEGNDSICFQNVPETAWSSLPQLYSPAHSVPSPSLCNPFLCLSVQISLTVTSSPLSCTSKFPFALQQLERERIFWKRQEIQPAKYKWSLLHTNSSLSWIEELDRTSSSLSDFQTTFSASQQLICDSRII